MLTVNDHIDDLIRHIELVREACILLGKRLIAKGFENEFNSPTENNLRQKLLA